MKYDTIREAASAWVKEFNAFPLNMIKKLCDAYPDDWREITPMSIGTRVWVWCAEYQDEGEVIELNGEIVKVQLDNGKIIETDKANLSREDADFFPIWGTMWQFSYTYDNDWLVNHLDEMAACGFRIYESEEFGYFFGIDGAGYDFYEEHWIPLYKATELHWHKEAET